MVSSGMLQRPQDSKVLFGWKEIANFLDAGVRTVQRYERNHGLPVRRPAGKSAAVMATVAELEAWVSARPLARASKGSDKPRPSLAWESLQAGMQRMQRLMGETNQLRKQISATVRTLHSSIRLVGPDSKAVPSSNDDHENDALADLKKQFKLLSFDSKVRTTG